MSRVPSSGRRDREGPRPGGCLRGRRQRPGPAPSGRCTLPQFPLQTQTPMSSGGRLGPTGFPEGVGLADRFQEETLCQTRRGWSAIEVSAAKTRT